MDDVTSLEEELLLEKFKQQQILIEALVCTQKQLMQARDAALDRALREELQMLSVSVKEVRPLGKGKRYIDSYPDSAYDDDEIVYRSCGPTEEDDGDEEADHVSEQSPPVNAEATEAFKTEATLERQVELLSQIYHRLQAAGDSITPAEVKELCSEVMKLSSATVQ
mmetsp:Transcript_18938/g.36786  ORF Transcript_18938/g.36786 Transcript_18938/m.36786 type:complete len:166 (+) Transcript_18938:259-756(+)